MKEGSLKTLSAIVRSRTYKQDVENSDIFSGVFQDIVVSLLRNSPYWMTNGTEQSYEDMMGFIAAVHKDQASLATKLWMSAEESRLSHFMRLVGDHLSHRLFVGYLRMLASLSAGTECAEYVLFISVLYS